MKKKDMKLYQSADGVSWGVEVTSPGASNAMVLFHHPDGSTSRKDRYAWYLNRGPEARSVTSRLESRDVLASLDDVAIANLFRRSMPVATAHAPGNVATNPAV